MTLFAIFAMIEIFDKLKKRFGIETKQSIKDKLESDMILEHEEKLNSIMEDIREMKESNKADAKVQRDKMNVLNQVLIEIKGVMDEMEQRRNDARRETLKQQLYNLYYKYKERAEKTGIMILSKCEYDQFWTAFKEYESPPLNGDGLIHSIVEVFMLGFTVEDD